MSVSKSFTNIIKHFDQMHSGTDLGKNVPVVEEIIEEEEIKEEEKEELEVIRNEERVILNVSYEEKAETEYHDIPFDPQTKTQSVEQSCRVCLFDLVEINHVGFQDSLKNFKNVTYLDAFKQCTGFEVNEFEPQHLCVNCAMKLVDAYELRQQCVETQKVLDELLSDDFEEGMEEEGMIVEELIEESPEEAFIEVYEKVAEDNITQERPCKIEFEILPEKAAKKNVMKKVKNILNTQRRTQTVSDDSAKVPCQICRSAYKSIRALRNHYNACHSELKVHKCQFCLRDFFPQLIDIHMSHCSQRHNTIRQLCPVCGEAASRNHIYRHIARAKAIDATGRVIDKPYECDICGARATTKNGIGIHIKSLHLQLKIQCSYCDMKVKSRSILGTHMRRYHPEIKKPLDCDFCEFQTASAASLIRHRAIHFGNRPHKCDICARQFVTKDAWRVHKATHSEERPHKCEVCTSPFKTRKALGAHMKTHKAHEYECPECRKSYLTNQQMRQHVMKNHPNFVLPPRGTILNKSWLKKQAKFELKRDATRVALEGELVETMEIETNTIQEEIYHY